MDERGDPQVGGARGASLVVRRATGAGPPAAARRRRRPGAGRGRRLRVATARCCRARLGGHRRWRLPPRRSGSPAARGLRVRARRRAATAVRRRVVRPGDVDRHVGARRGGRRGRCRGVPGAAAPAAGCCRRARRHGPVERPRRGPGARPALRAASWSHWWGRRVRGHGHARLERAAPAGRARRRRTNASESEMEQVNPVLNLGPAHGGAGRGGLPVQRFRGISLVLRGYRPTR